MEYVTIKIFLPLVICSIVLIIGLLIYCSSLSKIDNKKIADANIIGHIIIIIALGFIFCFPAFNQKPQAIDVYRNKTTLQITYRDSIPVDTLVIWKDEFYPNKRK